MFRQEALDRLSSPEELDKLMHITSPRLWLALAGIVGLIVAGIFWMIFASIPTRVLTTGALTQTVNGKLEPVVFASLNQGNEISPGQKATVSIVSLEGRKHHTLLADVDSINPFPVDERDIRRSVRVAGLARLLAREDKVIQVRLAFKGRSRIPLGPGMLVKSTITVDYQSPIRLAIP